MNENLSKTIKEARNEMRPLLFEGTTCSCCGQHVQIYRRTLTSSMIYGLILLSKASGDERGFIHIQDFFKNSGCPSSIHGDVPKLRFWGFIEGDGKDSADGNPANGMYRVLPKALGFIHGRILVQKSVKIYNNKFYGFDGPEVDVFTCIKNKFNYNQLMGKTVAPQTA